MICTKIPLKIIGIEFYLIEIEHLLCNKRLCLACVQNVRFNLKFSLKVNFFPPKTHFLSPYAWSSFLSSCAYLVIPHRRLTCPSPCSDIFVLTDEVGLALVRVFVIINWDHSFFNALWRHPSHDVMWAACFVVCAWKQFKQTTAICKRGFPLT